MLRKMLQGLAIGIANIIPGVSGGTMMVAMGIYDKLIHAITHLKSEFKKSMSFLIPIFLGIGVALIVFARIFEFLLSRFPIPTNFAFCGLIAGSLPFIFKNVKTEKVTFGKVASMLVFFAIVILMAVMGEASGNAADVSFNVWNVTKLLGVGIIAAATMVIPGVSGSMMLMIMGYYDTILATINNTIDALVRLDIPTLLECIGILLPFGIGVIIGIFVIAKVIEFLFQRARGHVFYAIIGLIVASPIAILLNASWQGFSWLTMIISACTFIGGWFIAGALGEK